ncbi:hypothetical protein AVEN_270222-1 [Araneus ventricosus]|uniref:DDE-1 domain-containing protein n=1 Tax=Araneus ventricosus TaxID=182803 RepID=A0A4Y2G0E1_ARAVE|nr:hypothetical protein AVEN_270222-1 [Araneus ventricosus]
MDNATSHPDDFKLKNISLVFLPPNIASMLQPLDQGIIRSFKVGYRKLLLRHVLSQISSCKSSEELAKSLSILDAISWTMSAFKKVEPGVEEYAKIDDDLSIEEENLHVSNFIHRGTTEALVLPEDDDEESPMEDCKIKDYLEALKYSEQLKHFLLNNEDSEGLKKLNPMNIHLEKLVCCGVCGKSEEALKEFDVRNPYLYQKQDQARWVQTLFLPCLHLMECATALFMFSFCGRRLHREKNSRIRLTHKLIETVMPHLIEATFLFLRVALQCEDEPLTPLSMPV